MAASPKRTGRRRGNVTDSVMEISTEEKLRKAEIKITALQKELASRTERVQRVEAQKASLRDKVVAYDADLEREQEDRHDVMSAMARQYKSTQQTLVAEINGLHTKIQDVEDELAFTKSYYQEQLAEKDKELRDRDQQIVELNAQMEEMAERFHQMLSDTLDSIGKRIERAQASYETSMNASTGGPSRGHLADLSALN